MRTPSLVPNAVIAEKYRLLRPLGEGAMGVVWAAANVLTSRQVALKFIVGPDEELRRRMLREARACGALQHRNIVDIHDVAQAGDGNPILVMQLLSGETLADLLARTRRLPPARAAAIGRDVASALAAAHAIGIVHRDVKPANIFLHQEPGGEPIVKVLDFGVSKDLRGSDSIRTVSGGVVGSPSYMSPEQARADADIDGRADIWSLGVTLFEMLTGTLPFNGGVEDVLRQIFTAEIPVVSRRIRQVDPALSDLVSRCMERDRARRIASAEELASRLDAFLRSQAPSRGAGGPPGATERGAPGDAEQEAETIKIAAAAADVLAPRKDPRAEAPRAPPGVTSSTAPFARAAPGDLLDAGAAGPPAMQAAAADRRAARRASPYVFVGVAGAACAVGALLYALLSFQAPSTQTLPPSSAGSSAPGDLPNATTGNPPADPSSGAVAVAVADAPPGPTAESAPEEPPLESPDAGPRPSLRGVRPPVAGTTSPAEPSVTPVPTGDGAFNRGAATVAVSAAAAGARSCKSASGHAGPGRAKILFRPDGTVGSVLLDPPHRGTPQGACIEGMFRGVRVPPFVGPAVIVNKSFTMP